MNIECQHCGSCFSSKKTLLEHQKTSKYCAEFFQEKEAESYACSGCEKPFTTKSNLNKHQKKCDKIMIVQLRGENEELRKEVEILKKQCKRQAKKLDDFDAYFHSKIASSKLNPIFSKIKTDPSFICTTENVVAKMKGYTLRNGRGELTKFITSLILDDEDRCYIRTDPTRNNFHKWTGEKWVSDHEAQFFREILNIMRPVIVAKIREMMDEDVKLPLAEQVDVMNHRDKFLKPMYDGIIYPDSDEREILIKDMIKRTAHVTNPGV